MLDGRPSLVVAIVSWNTRELLRDCVSALLRHPPSRPMEIWVADNDSSDGSVEMLRRDFPQVHRIESAENLGFAAATNQVLARATGRDVLLLNSDARVLPGALDRLLHALDRDASLGIVGAHLLNPDGSLQASCWRAPSVSRELAHLWHIEARGQGLTYPMARWRDGRARRVDVVQGACMLVRGATVEDIGPLDEGYFMFSEETEWCERARRRGWRVAWIPGAFVLHHGGGSTKRVADDMFVELYRSKLRFFRRNRGPRQALAFKLGLALAALPRVAWGMLGRRPALARRYARLLVEMPQL